MTALAEAFAKSGVRPEDAEFDIAIAKYINSGGTIAGAIARINVAAERMSGMGHMADARERHALHAQTRQPVEGGGAANTLPVVGQIPDAAPPSSNRGGDDHAKVASGHRSSVVSDRDPKPQRAAIDFGAAAHAIKTKLAQTVLDRIKTSDGRAWGDVGAHELDGMSRDGARWHKRLKTILAC